MTARKTGRGRPDAASGSGPAARGQPRSRWTWSSLTPAIVAGVLLLGALSRPVAAGEIPPCVEVVAAPDGGAVPRDLEVIRDHLSGAVQCPDGRRVRVTVSSRDGRLRLRAVLDGPDGFASSATLEGLEPGEGVRGSLQAWGRDLTDDMRSMEAGRILRRRNAPDWLRVSFLAGATGAIGGRLALVTVKWDHAYLTVLQGGCVLAPWRSYGLQTSTYAFVGPEAGAAFRWGDHWLGVGAQVGFGVQSGGAMAQTSSSEHKYFVLGGMIAPTIRYRHYWGLFGLEASLEWPVTFGGGGGDVGTPWPILGLGVGF